MVNQMGGWLSAQSDNAFAYSVTKQVGGKTAFAEIALNHVNNYAQATISQIVSASGVEEPNTPIVKRNGVTSVTFTILVSDSGATARWMINLWS